LDALSIILYIPYIVADSALFQFYLLMLE